MDYKDFIKLSLEDVSKIAKQNFGKVKGVSKTEDNNQVLTETDLEIGKFLADKICKTYPKHNIIDEEAGVIDNGSEYTWVIDPIDGTSNFAQGIPMYGIMLGLLKEDKPIAGGISLPEFSELYLAESGDGAYCNGKKIRVSEEKDLKNSLISYGIDSHPENPKFTEDECLLLSKIVLEIRNLRSSNSAYDFAMVANGKYGAFLSRAGKIWDNVAVQVIIEEAGGIHTDFFGKPINYSNSLKRSGETFNFCVAAPDLHRKLQKIIHNTQ